MMESRNSPTDDSLAQSRPNARAAASASPLPSPHGAMPIAVASAPTASRYPSSDSESAQGDAFEVLKTQPGKFSIVPILRAAMGAGAVAGSHYQGAWSDIGIAQRLAELNDRLTAQ